MINHDTRWAPAMVLALVAALSAAAPAGAQQTYQLAAVNGEALPALIEEESDGCVDELLSATLVLTQGGEWTLVSTTRETCGNEVDVDEDEDDGTYAAEGSALTFFDDDGSPPRHDADPEIEIDDLHTGTRNGNELTVQLADSETVLTFRM